jgi:hypothetical protein
MKDRTFTFKTGRPVAKIQVIGFLPTKRDQIEHAEMFKMQERIESRNGVSEEVDALRALAALFGGR